MPFALTTPTAERRRNQPDHADGEQPALPTWRRQFRLIPGPDSMNLLLRLAVFLMGFAFMVFYPGQRIFLGRKTKWAIGGRSKIM